MTTVVHGPEDLPAHRSRSKFEGGNHVHGGVGEGSARSVLASISDLTILSEGLRDDSDLVDAGLNSGDLIRLLAQVERSFGIELDLDDLPGPITLQAIDAVIARKDPTRPEILGEASVVE
ncbi:acyl carrier protein [Nocardia sp. NPDC059177]|uniref:acyl carrier protein n=1 Tax=Nocardia sp. NPDC059177 TaxID=3346759 RepID=UPI0036B369E5